MAQRKHLVLVHFQVFLFQEVNRTIAEPILEQLQGLSILVSEIDRYTSVVERLKSLEQLWFTLNDVFDYRPYTIDDDGPTLAFAFAVDIGGTGSQEEAMRTMIDFLKSHARLFQGSTQDSDLYRWRVLVHLPTVLSPEVSFEMLQIVPPQPGMKSLTDNSWTHFAPHPQSIDMSRVESIGLFRMKESEFKRLGDERGRFLQRCRRLRGLRTQSLGPGSPNWAVQEKRAAIGERQGGNGQGALSIEMGRPAYLEHGLAPIEQVYIHEDRAPFQKEVYDIMFAFSQTLTNFEADVLDGPPASLRQLRFGQNWIDLPKLRTLCLRAGERNRLVVDRNPLMHCPNVSSVENRDKTFAYQCQDIVPGLPAGLGKLQRLTLVGWPALMFHPGTLFSTTRFSHLHVGMFWRRTRQATFRRLWNWIGRMAFKAAMGLLWREQEQEQKVKRKVNINND